MPEIGETLREARMRRRIDMAEVESATKIRAKYLRALESEEWELLPGPTFVKTFLRTYAEYLELDARLLVEEYKQRFERPAGMDVTPLNLRRQRRLRSVNVKCHDVETSLLEGVLSRGDRRIADAIELAWRRGARMDSWSEHFNAQRWWNAIEDCGLDLRRLLHEPYEVGARLPWDHVNVKYGRTFLEKEQQRSVLQLSAMAEAV